MRDVNSNAKVVPELRLNGTALTMRDVNGIDYNHLVRP